MVRMSARVKRLLAGLFNALRAESLAAFAERFSAVPLLIDIMRTKYSSSRDWPSRHWTQHGTVTRWGRGLTNRLFGGTWSLVAPGRSPQYTQGGFERVLVTVLNSKLFG